MNNGRDQTAIPNRLLERRARLFADDFQKERHWAEPGKRRLKHIEPDKGGKPKPVDVDSDGQENADQDKGAGYGKYDSIDGHGGLLGWNEIVCCFLIMRQHRKKGYSSM